MTKLRFVERLVPIREEGPYKISHTVRVLQQYGEIEQPTNSTDSDGNPIYDGPTVQGWFDVPLVTESAADTEGKQ